MPLKRCTKDGKEGWKWGDKGFCYTGPGAKGKARKQALAIMKERGLSDDAISRALRTGKD